MIFLGAKLRMKIDTVGPIAFIALGLVAIGVGALLGNFTGIEPSGFYSGGAITFLLGIYLAIDRKRSRNLFKFSW